MSSIADKLNLNGVAKPLRFGDTFEKNFKDAAFYTIRYDFKPASVDTKKKGTVEVGDKNEVTVTVPHVEGAGTSQTVFKGNKKPAAKECVLIIDHKKGEIFLERISQNIYVKKTRAEGSSRINQRPSTPYDNTDKKKSSPHNYSPTMSTQNSLSSFSLPKSSQKSNSSSKSTPVHNASGSMPSLGFDGNVEVGMISGSSSDSDSNSSSSSSSESESEYRSAPGKAHGNMNGASLHGTMPSSQTLLDQDLNISGSDDDTE